jgi:outer membrane protein TolC
VPPVRAVLFHAKRSSAACAAALAVLAGGAASAGAQTPSPPVSGQPASTQPARATPPGPLSLNTFLGGVPTGTATRDTITVTAVDAVLRALKYNLGVLLTEQSIGQAQGARGRMLAELLPNVSGRVSETREKINLQAFGFGAPGGPSFPGVPNIVGPFNVFDARVSATQSILDFGAINDARSAAHGLEAARLTHKSARDFVIHVAADLYIQALASSARADSARAQLDTADALYKTAVDLKQNGIVPGIDVLRAEVQLNTERQRATATENDFEKAKLQLARVIGLPLGQKFELDPNLPDLPGPTLSVEQAVEQAYKTRPDYQAAIERVRAAEASRAAVIGGALPSIHVNADVGEIGLTAGEAKNTFTLVGAVNVPIFQGGRTQAKLAEADAELKTRRFEADDLKASIYYEVRDAFLDLQATSEQLQVATKARELAGQQLTQARDRFAAGVASNIEVIQAQEAVALANEQFISAQYGFDLAKGAVIRGIGSAEEMLRSIVGGSR